MNNSSQSDILAYCFFVLLLASLFLISFQVILTTSPVYDTYYATVYGEVDESYHLAETNEWAQGNANVFLRYLENKSESILLPITNDEYTHMSDVKELYTSLKSTLSFFVLIFVWVSLLYFGKRQYPFLKWLEKNKKKAIYTHVGFYVIIVTSLFFFNKIFVFLHTVFFTNDLWLLPYNSITIQTFPQSFFVFFFVCVIIGTSLSYWVLTILVPKLRQHM